MVTGSLNLLIVASVVIFGVVELVALGWFWTRAGRARQEVRR